MSLKANGSAAHAHTHAHTRGPTHAHTHPRTRESAIGIVNDGLATAEDLLPLQISLYIHYS